ncbi:ABC transporter ATP-binding protein [Paenibacillus sp. Aloe-11]|uniref:ABC transporter ATP-binding protein n=1 Tax=Paenibacillus sp. Aloe-11 TaxID=1050222 RepID=UPI0002E1BC98|nr:ABC transporter ATP-binding protein [Paenibacillus sp. Aloe-11]
MQQKDINDNLLLEFHAINKKFGGKTVLNDFSCKLYRGEVIGLFGPSGCGKTTLLNLAAGLSEPTAGHIRKYSDSIAYIFQEPRLIPWKSVLDNVQYVMKKTNGEAMVEKAIEALQKVGLAHVQDSYPRQLSGGMKQRVAIARALATDPQIILMDEPFSALDVAIKRELQKDITTLMEEREIGVIYVSHDPEEIARLADYILCFSPSCATFLPGETLEVPRPERTESYIQGVKQRLLTHISQV